jgi:hypothetical protein
MIGRAAGMTVPQLSRTAAMWEAMRFARRARGKLDA